MIHDETIDRTTNGKGRVADLPYDQLRRFDAGGGESIPLLTEVLDEFGRQCLLNIFAGALRDSAGVMFPCHSPSEVLT